MANTLSPFGALPYEGASGISPTFGSQWPLVLYSDSTKIYRGDLVKLGSNGYVTQWTAGTAVSQAYGIFWGCEYYSLSQGQVTFSKYWPGSDVPTNAVVKAQVMPILTAVPMIFYIQSGNSAGGATAITQADVGQTIDVSMGTGSTLTGMSAMYADQNTQGTTATQPFRILGPYVGPGAGTVNGTDAASANNWIIVQTNIYQETGI